MIHQFFKLSDTDCGDMNENDCVDINVTDCGDINASLFDGDFGNSLEQEPQKHLLTTEHNCDGDF